MDLNTWNKERIKGFVILVLSVSDEVDECFLYDVNEHFFSIERSTCMFFVHLFNFSI